MKTRPLKPYYSKGKKISMSTQHENMFIIEHANGQWHNIVASVEYIHSVYKPD